MTGSNKSVKHEDNDSKNGNTEVVPNDPMRRLEEALVLCKFGRFHFRMLCASFASALGANLTVTATSFVLPNAECDLDMTLMQKGVLNAAPFVGQIATAFFTGFVTDAFGRKPFLVWAHFALFLCVLLEGSSQNYWMMLIVKLFEGLLVCISYSTAPALLSECTHKNVRDRVMILNSSFMASASIVSALFAWGVLPRDLDFVLFNGYFVLHSWNIYIYACSMWSGLAALFYFFLPESPKFLLAHGQNEKALEVLKSIYNENTGADKDNFPITSFDDLNTGIPANKQSLKQQFKDAVFNMKDLFRRPLGCHLLLISCMTFLMLLSISALRLWFPQISTIVENFKAQHNGEPARFCVMITDYTDNLNKPNDMINQNITEVKTCLSLGSGTETFTNGIIMGVAALMGMFLSGYLVDLVGIKPLIFTLLTLSTAFSTALYWTDSSIQIALMISGILAFVQTTYGLFNVMFVRIFPTTVRTLALSLILMNGRVGSLTGSILFPVMLEKGCMVPFALLAASTFVVALLSILLPNTQKQNKDGDK